MFGLESPLIVIVGVLIAHPISFAILVIYKLWTPDKDIIRDIKLYKQRVADYNNGITHWIPKPNPYVKTCLRWNKTTEKYELSARITSCGIKEMFRLQPSGIIINN